MKQHERSALIVYLEQQLLVACGKIKPHLNTRSVGVLYEEVYNILHDLESSILLDNDEKIAEKKKHR